ncbi:MAG: RDD family protein [Planctomycetes bacterium]|nr:RDD family protein [Planctomycetota bacterium]
MDNPYQAPQSDAPAAVDEHLHYCGFWRRFLAALIDALLLVPLTLLLGFAIYGSAYLDSEKLIQGPFDVVISYVLPFVLSIGMWITFGGTPGKLWLGVKIIDQQTKRFPSLGQSVGRYFAYFLSMIPLFLDYFWMLWDGKRQCWHDKLSGTIVVRSNRR